MNNTTLGRRLSAAIFCAACLPAPSANGATVAVDCDAGGTVAGALNDLEPGDTLLVSGLCREHVTIPAEVSRITLDGQGKTTIQHPGSAGMAGPATHVFYVRGKEIAIKGFRLTGGRDGVHVSGPASVVIDGNAIVDNMLRGIHVDKGSVAQIINNTIENNRGIGVNVSENSNARIGFFIPPSQVLAPNAIRSNGDHGINVERGSSAWIVGNTISNNGGSGVYVDRMSQADVVANVIDANRADGVTATHGSGVNLQSEASPRPEGPNQTGSKSKNAGFGIRCAIGGYVDGPLGTLSGASGAKDFDDSCIDLVIDPPP